MTPERQPGIELGIDYATDVVPDLKRVRHRWCAEVDAAHQQDPRCYAHSGHMDNTICWGHAVADLPIGHQLGICLHEFGHELSDHAEKDDDFTVEGDADEAVLKVLGVAIEYVGVRELQWVDPEELPDA